MTHLNTYSTGIEQNAVTCASSFTVSGGGSYCSGGSGVTITLSGSETRGKIPVEKRGYKCWFSFAGTGAALSFNNETAAGTYTIEATNSNSYLYRYNERKCKCLN